MNLKNQQNKNRNTKFYILKSHYIQKTLIFSIIFIFVSVFFIVQGSEEQKIFAQEKKTTPFIEKTKSISDLDKEIKEKKNLLEELSAQITNYKQKIEQKRREGITLVNEISILENQIAKTELDIKSLQEKINYTELEIEKTELEINEKQRLITLYKERLAELIRTIHDLDQQNFFTVFLLKDRFTEIFDHIKYIENLNSDLEKLLEDVIEAKRQLSVEEELLEEEKEKLEDLQAKLVSEKASLEEQIDYKESLLLETRQSEQRFQNLVWQNQQEQAQIDSEIQSLEKKLRKQLKDLDLKNGLNSFSSEFSWPVDPSQGITSYFHDPDYPFRYIFEHPAIDIRAAQSTPVQAAASGYVARVRDGGYGYSFIMIIHADGLSTVYGHISKILVEQDTYVTRGQVIALSGGMPGTLGAGRLTTGPHLHFEVRVNGIPVDPLDYLP